MISKNTGAGVMYFIGAGFWAIEFLWSFWTLKLVYANFRGKNHSLGQAKREAAVRAAASAV